MVECQHELEKLIHSFVPHGDCRLNTSIWTITPNIYLRFLLLWIPLNSLFRDQCERNMYVNAWGQWNWANPLITTLLELETWKLFSVILLLVHIMCNCWVDMRLSCLHIIIMQHLQIIIMQQCDFDTCRKPLRTKIQVLSSAVEF